VKGFRKKIKFYALGKPLIMVTPKANAAIKSIRSCKRELEEICNNDSEIFKLFSRGMNN